MLKTEVYKLLHTKNIFYLFGMVVVLAIYLSVAIIKMDIANIEDGMSIIFTSASSVIMLYFMMFSTMSISRDYSVKHYLVLVGTGVDRKSILFAKYVMFLVFGAFILLVHGFLSILILQYHFQQWKMDSFIKSLLYFFPYMVILSMIFLLSIIGRTMIKSLLLNLLLIVSFGVMGQVVNTDGIPWIPLHMLKEISEQNTMYHIPIIILSLFYCLFCFVCSYFVFDKQEL